MYATIGSDALGLPTLFYMKPYKYLQKILVKSPRFSKNQILNFRDLEFMDDKKSSDFTVLDDK